MLGRAPTSRRAKAPVNVPPTDDRSYASARTKVTRLGSIALARAIDNMDSE